MTYCVLVRAGSVAAVVASALLSSGCQEVVDFTRKPIHRAKDLKPAIVQTPIFVTWRTDVRVLESQLVEKVPEVIATVRTGLRRAACVLRRGRKRCLNAVVTGKIMRSGEARLSGDASGVRLEIPVRYELTARGIGYARSQTETVSGAMTMTALYSVTLNDDWQPSVALARQLQVDGEKTIKLLNGQLSIEKLVRFRLARRLAGSARDLRQLIRTQSLKDMTRRAWRSLHYPVQIASKPELWLRGEPYAAHFGGFKIAGGVLEMRIALMTKLHTYIDERPLPLIAQELPQLRTDEPTIKRSRLSMPLLVPYPKITKAINARLASGEPMDLGPEGKDLTIAVNAVRLYPSNSRLALALDLEVEQEDQWRSLVGKAFLLGRPQVRRGTSILDLQRVEFTAPTPSPDLFKDGKFLLPKAPFVDAFKKAVKFDLNDAFKKLLAGANASTNRRMGDRFWLKGRFEQIEVGAITPLRDALQLNVELIGDLTINGERGGVAVGAEAKGTAE